MNRLMLAAWLLLGAPGLGQAPNAHAQRTADAEVYLLLFDYGQGPTVARLIRSVRQVFEPDQTFDLLRGAADHPRLSSMALYQMAPLASAEPRGGDYLLEHPHYQEN